VFSFVLLFCGFDGYEQYRRRSGLHDATQIIGNSGASPSIMGLHDVLRNIEQMLVPFKHYIEASEAPMAQVLPMA
jgi:hypothetical protein